MTLFIWCGSRFERIPKKWLVFGVFSAALGLGCSKRVSDSATIPLAEGNPSIVVELQPSETETGRTGQAVSSADARQLLATTLQTVKFDGGNVLLHFAASW